MRGWKGLIIVTLILSVFFHVATIKAIPYVVMTVAKKKLMEREQVGVNEVAYKKLITEDERVVIRPSPDLLYSGMIFDVSKMPLLISASVAEGQYWALNFYDMATNNFGIFDDRKIKDGKFKIILAHKDAEIKDTQGYQVLRSSGNTGIMLNRIVVPDRSVSDEYQKLQHTLKVTPYIE
ncbi:MAG: DUF1254 domain-containing protein [Desulfuromusa sp.]|nr:DUF1254 domain-containing protein [Desulfuromusa sp.]